MDPTASGSAQSEGVSASSSKYPRKHSAKAIKKQTTSVGARGGRCVAPEGVHGADLGEHVAQALLRGIVRDVSHEDRVWRGSHIAARRGVVIETMGGEHFSAKKKTKKSEGKRRQGEAGGFFIKGVLHTPPQRRA